MEYSRVDAGAAVGRSYVFGYKIILIAFFINFYQRPASADERRDPEISTLELDEDGRPILKVKLCPLDSKNSGKELRFIMDTAATYTAIDATIPVSYFWDDEMACGVMEPTGSSAATPVVAVKRMIVAGIIRDEIPALRLDIKNSNLGKFQDDPVDGILGMSFLYGTRFVLDLEHKRVEWWRKSWPEGKRLPMLFRGGKVPLLSVSIGENKGECVLDTAMAGGLGLPWHMRPKGTGRPVHIQGLSGMDESAEAMDVADVATCGVAWKNVNVIFNKYSCVVGLEVWSAGRTCFDFISDQVTFTHGNGSGLAIDRVPKCQLQLCWDRRRRPPVLSIPFVVPGSAMALAGFLPNDEVVYVGPLRGRNLTRHAVQELAAKGQPQRWGIIRAGQPLEFIYTWIPGPQAHDRQ